MNERNKTELPTTALAVLGLLSFGPQSGYDLKQFADRSISHFYWSPAKSQVYAELRRLESLGLVDESFVEQDNRPDKRVYTITAEGRSTLARWLDETGMEHDVYKSSMLLKVFFGASADPPELIRQLQGVIDREQELLRQLEESRQRCEAAGDDGVFSLLTIRAGLSHVKATIDWAKEAQQVLAGLQERQG